MCGRKNRGIVLDELVVILEILHDEEAAAESDSIKQPLSHSVVQSLLRCIHRSDHMIRACEQKNGVQRTELPVQSMGVAIELLQIAPTKQGERTEQPSEQMH